MKGQPKKRKYIRISYTNIDVFLSKRLECMDHLERDKPHRVETKLRPNIQVDRSGDGNYGVWRKDRMKKGGDCVDRKGLDSEEREPRRGW